jgi:hypothetical protein
MGMAEAVSATAMATALGSAVTAVTAVTVALLEANL